MRSWLLFALVILPAIFLVSQAQARSRSSGGNPSGVVFVPAGNGRVIPQGVGPFLYDPNRTLYEWEINAKQYPNPCYYDSRYGQWVGPCNISLDQPGYSITVPNRIRR